MTVLYEILFYKYTFKTPYNIHFLYFNVLKMARPLFVLF